MPPVVAPAARSTMAKLRSTEMIEGERSSEIDNLLKLNPLKRVTVQF